MKKLEEVEKILGSLGYCFLEEYYYNKKRRVVFSDDNGYKYDVPLGNLIYRKNNISAVDVGNPFSLENISNWIFLNKKNFVLCNDSCYVGAKGDLFFRCLSSSCGEIFKSNWDSIYHNKGCPFCRGLAIGEKNNLLVANPEVARDWNYDLNEDLPSQYTICSGFKKYWRCAKCGYGKDGEWISSISNRSKGRGCPACANQVVTDKNRLSILCTEVSSEWSYSLNGNLKPEHFSYGSGKTVWWKCHRCEKEWKAPIANRTSGGTGCPRCSSSKGEEEISNFLIKNKISFQTEVPLNECKYKGQLYLDFYLSDYGIAIEYNGKHHYEPVRFSYSISEEQAKENLKEQKKKDKIKEKYCKDNNIQLLIIPYWEFDNIEKILEEALFQ